MQHSLVSIYALLVAIQGKTGWIELPGNDSLRNAELGGPQGDSRRGDLSFGLHDGNIVYNYFVLSIEVGWKVY